MQRPATFLAFMCALSATPLLAQAGAQTGSQSASPALQSVPSLDTLGNKPVLISPLTQPTFTPGMILLVQLEDRFAKAVAAGGGKAFASWFADDAVTLNNGRPAVLGRAAIGANADWSPKDYQLSWIPQGAQMGPSNDMGFTWGHYEGHSKDKKGEPVVVTGRYMTVWRKLPDGTWKVALDASANEPPAAGECCTAPKP